MSAIATKIVENYNLSPKMSVTDLSRYTSEFLENLTDDRKSNQARRRLREGFKFSNEQVGVLIPNQRGGKSKAINIIEGSCKIAIVSPPKDLEEEIIREITKRILQNRYGFSKDQVDALFTIQTNGQCGSISGETIGEMAHRLLWDKLSIRDIRAEAHALALSAKNANAGSSRLSRLRRELKSLGALPTIVEATKFPDFTTKSRGAIRKRLKLNVSIIQIILL
ncbi:9396_t:CDS:2 [Paraglomus occultum]|uniref:9396_t:CDS:1 n=1 Tax=Paraglomus occultum TaxID=144539 RepID=A0A9N8VMZ6_9GLOM|nr:9396_t:CDS:2 [Paraglomus occultum]